MYIDLKPGNSYLLTRHSSKIEEQKIIWLLYNICWLKFNELSCFQSDSEKTLLLHIFYNILWLANITLSLRVPWSMNLYVNIQFLIVRIMDHGSWIIKWNGSSHTGLMGSWMVYIVQGGKKNNYYNLFY